MKITRFQDVPTFTRSGSNDANYCFSSLPAAIDGFVKELGLDLNPDFQRGHVWTEEQQVRFMEFHLRGGTTGRVLYFNCPWWNRTMDAKGDFVIVDGKQRLQAIRRFVSNEIPAFGSFFREFTDSPRWAVNTMIVNVNDLKTRAEVLSWYLEMNTGGVVHSSEEIEKVKRLLEEERGKTSRRKKTVKS